MNVVKRLETSEGYELINVDSLLCSFCPSALAEWQIRQIYSRMSNNLLAKTEVLLDGTNMIGHVSTKYNTVFSIKNKGLVDVSIHLELATLPYSRSDELLPLRSGLYLSDTDLFSNYKQLL